MKWPLGWPVVGYPGFLRVLIAVVLGKISCDWWEIQVGPSVCIEAGNHIWATRSYLRYLIISPIESDY
ncbi:hypothetical protein VNO77_04704 [Canavalia gladiata]|uniref:Uncharacterized protein n=1 Tax=Canavalia gladiata TaxID=3824 RepID=A0AAN9N242_CANGL